MVEVEAAKFLVTEQEDENVSHHVMLFVIYAMSFFFFSFFYLTNFIKKNHFSY